MKVVQDLGIVQCIHHALMNKEIQQESIVLVVIRGLAATVAIIAMDVQIVIRHN